MEEKQKFAQFLCAKRIEAGLTQKQLAQRLFVSDAAVSKWERGLSYPDITLVASICRELHITEHEFVTACDDVAAREEKRQAKNFRRFLLIYQIVMGCAYLLAHLSRVLL